MTAQTGYHKKTLEKCKMYQIPITKYSTTNLYDLIREIEKDWFLVSSVELNDSNGDEIFIGDLVEDDEGRLFEVTSTSGTDRKHFSRNELKCIRSSNRHDDDHIKPGKNLSFNDWMYPDNLLKIVGNVYQNKNSGGINEKSHKRT